MKKKNMYMILAAVIVVIAIIILAQLNKAPSEISETGEEIANCGEGTVIYNDEDLCWQRSVGPKGIANWGAAKAYCEDLVLAGENDWNLPTTDELSSIVDDADEELAINVEYFQDTAPLHYWTSSEYKAGFHWYIHFELGYQGFAPDYKENYGIRCVRANTLF